MRLGVVWWPATVNYFRFTVDTGSELVDDDHVLGASRRSSRPPSSQPEVSSHAVDDAAAAAESRSGWRSAGGHYRHRRHSDVVVVIVAVSAPRVRLRQRLGAAVGHRDGFDGVESLVVDPVLAVVLLVGEQRCKAVCPEDLGRQVGRAHLSRHARWLDDSCTQRPDVLPFTVQYHQLSMDDLNSG